ncbi:hypothetical protein GCM10020295_70140 [Streptomyces cinereospinus]
MLDDDQAVGQDHGVRRGRPAVPQACQDRDRDREQDQAEVNRGRRVVPRGQVARQGHGPGAAGEDAGEGDRGAGLAERAAQARTEPAAMQGAISGRATRRNAVQREAPKVVAASS